MPSHRFSCGEDVLLTGHMHHGLKPGIHYAIIACLPYEGEIPRYRVKAAHELFSRVALEDIMVPSSGQEPLPEAEIEPVRSSSISAIRPGRQPGQNSRRIAAAGVR